MENLTEDTLQIIRRLPAGGDLDSLIAQYLLRWRKMNEVEWSTMLGLNPYFHLFDQFNVPPRDRFMWDDESHIRWIPAFSKDDSTALSLADRLRGKYLFSLREQSHPLEIWEASFGKFSMKAETRPLAICRATVCVIAHQSGMELRESIIRASVAIEQLNQLKQESQ